MPHIAFFLFALVLLWAIARRTASQPIRPAILRVQAAQPKAAPAQREAAAPIAVPLPFVTGPVPLATEPNTNARIRDRYVAARFPRILASSADLADGHRVVTIARLLFQEDRYDDAQELLELAIEQLPGNKGLRLARLEITFLHRDDTRYVALADEFQRVHPGSREWSEIARLGRALAPNAPLFGAGHGESPYEHYGPWPDMPNWIHASWDLTPEVLAGEFHLAMRDQTTKGT